MSLQIAAPCSLSSRRCLLISHQRSNRFRMCFVAVVDAGSLSGAAPEVHRSQSAVSMQLKKLEEALGCQLLLRGPRQHHLTADGQKLLGYARRMLGLIIRFAQIVSFTEDI